MQAIKNKLHIKSKGNKVDGPKFVQETTETTTTQQNGHIVDEHVTRTVTETPLNSSIPMPPPMPSNDYWMQGSQQDYGRFFDDSYLNNYNSMNSSIPIPPPMPTNDYWMQGSSQDYGRYFDDSYLSSGSNLHNSRTFEMLPTQYIEKPVVIHETIRQEQVQEIQPVIQIEKDKTEIRQITQPLFDKEIKPVIVEQRTLPIEVLPTIEPAVLRVEESVEQSTRTYEPTLRQVVEKKPIIEETEKWRIIEEVQPIIYREVIVPHIVRTSRPMREVIVSEPVFSEFHFQGRYLSEWERERYQSFLSRQTVLRHDISQSDLHVMPVQNLNVTNLSKSMPVHQKKMIEEDTITTTTTTSVASTAAYNSGNTRSSGVVGTSAPVVVDQKHVEKTGLRGEKIIQDSVTTQNSTYRPTSAV